MPFVPIDKSAKEYSGQLEYRAEAIAVLQHLSPEERGIDDCVTTVQEELQDDTRRGVSLVTCQV